MSPHATPPFMPLRRHVYLVTNAVLAYKELRAYLQPDFELRVSTADEAIRLCASAWQELMPQAVAVAVEWSEDNAGVILAVKHIARAASVPVLALCGPNEAEQVAALVVGADDVLRVPLKPILLQARLIAYRRNRPPTPDPADDARDASSAGDSQSAVPDAHELEVTPTVEPSHEVYHAGSVRLNQTARQFYIEDEPVELTVKEFDLMTLLMHDSGACCTRDDILSQVWGIDFDTETNVLDVHIYALRRKLKRHGITELIQTVRGVGYRIANRG